MSPILLILGNILTTVALTGANAGLNLLCTNDYEELMSCNFDAQNCSEYNMTLVNEERTKRCTFSQCGTRCCCSIEMMLVLGDSFTANVVRGGRSVESKEINITDTIKLKPPSILPVKEFNGNFEVRWKTNIRKSLRNTLQGMVTYHKKGENDKKIEIVDLITNDDQNYYKILGRDLEPSTTYVVSVKTYTSLSGQLSNSSDEQEFKTPVSPATLKLAVIFSLSFAAVIISGAIFGCCVKAKTNWWDRAAKCQKPKLLDIQPKTPEILSPVLPVIYPVCVEPLIPESSTTESKESPTYSGSGSPKSSGISTGSSSLSYPNTEPVDIINSVRTALMKTFPNFGPVSPVATNPLRESDKDSGLLSSPYNPCSVRADYSSSGSSCFDNKTYSILIPSGPCQVSTDISGIQMQAEMPCDPAYQSSESDKSSRNAQQLVNLSPVASPLMLTDMSYQQCNNADSGGFSYTEDSSLSSISSGTDTTASCEAMCDNFDELISDAMQQNVKCEEVTRCDENPCYGGVHSSPIVDYEYQAFQNVVEQPDTVIPEQRGSANFPDESKAVLPEIMNNAQGAVDRPEFERPFLCFVSADQSVPVIVDSGYQSV